MLHAAALFLQVAGAAMAIWALIGEFRAARKQRESQQVPEFPKAPWPGPSSPWVASFPLPVLFRARSMNTAHIQEMALETLAEAAAALDDARAEAASDWERQQDVNEELFDGYRQVIEDRLKTDAKARDETRRRVVIEFGGVTLVTIGTVLPDLVSAAVRVMP